VVQKVGAGHRAIDDSVMLDGSLLILDIFLN